MKRKDVNSTVLMEQGLDLIGFYRNHPSIAASDLLGVDFAPIQQVVFNDMWFKNYNISVMGRGGGKTFMLGALATLSCMLYPGYRVGLIGPVFRQSLVIIPNTYDTFWTGDGMVTGSTEFYDSIEEGYTKVQSLESQNTIVSKWKNDDRACRSIKTTKGFELAGTVDHAVVVLDDGFNLVFKDLQDIDSSNYIAIKTGFNYFGNDNTMPTFDEHKLCWRSKDCDIPKELTPDLSYLFGMIVGDGCVTFRKNDKKPRLDFVNEDRDLLYSFHKYTKEYFGIETKEQPRRNNTKELQFSNKKLCMYLLKCGFTRTTALDKKIPDVIKKASRENFIAFLQGLMDTDGGVYIQHHKKGGTHCEIHLSTSSLQLAKEVQSVLLNLGIVSNLGISKKAEIRQLSQGNKPSKCATGYKVRITGIPNIEKFRDNIGFRCEHKREKLDSYLSNHFNKESSLSRSIGLPNDIVVNNHSKCKEFYDKGLYFVKMIDSEYFMAPTIDAEVENEHCYWSSGFISHNSKMIFAEVEKLYSRSEILRECVEKKPTRGSDTCYLKFKSVGGVNGSYIEALPLGVDGSKIRGSRFYLICIDELAQVPDKIIDMVIRPFAATTLEPMENVRKIEQQRKMIEMGLATEDDFEAVVNKMVMTSSGFYKFNHMWKRMKDHWLMMDEQGEKSQYAVHQVPYWDLPEGFLDLNNIEESRRIMSDHEFRMEYEADMISDSEGFFKASLLEACTIGSGVKVEHKGEKGSSYIIGVDPNQGGSASCGIIIVKVGATNHIVNVLELKGHTTQEMTEVVIKVCNDFNIIRIFMDQGGGGKAIMDLLDDGYGGNTPIIDVTDDDKKYKKGRHILYMVNFNPSWIADANFTSLALFEEGRLKFPEPPEHKYELTGAGKFNDLQAAVFERIQKLKSQMLNIVVTQTASGLLHFDTPKKGQNKDLYSALILAAHGARLVEKELEGDVDPILHNESGLVRPAKSSGDGHWDTINKRGPTVKSQKGLHLAVLEKRM